MSYSSICISSGHGKFVRGAAGSPIPPQLDEVDEARRVVDRVAAGLRRRGVIVDVFHDDTSHDQSTNLTTIVNHHNSVTRQLDVSVHFNASDNHQGREVLYYSQEELSAELSAAIAEAGHLTDRGPKHRPELAFLSGTEEPSVLIETAFCDNTSDSNLYHQYFENICAAIVDILSDGDTGAERPPAEALLQVAGAVSWFGGPTDMGVAPDEPLAFATPANAPHLFLPEQPPGTTGDARRLNCKAVNYVACRWDYDVTPRDMLLSKQALVRSVRTGRATRAYPADWGPNQSTNRVADISENLMRDLDLETDDDVIVIFPAPEDNT